MIAARLAGGNLFFGFLGGGFWELSELSELSEHSERIGALGFFEGIFGWGILFLGGGGGVLDCKCWKKLKND